VFVVKLLRGANRPLYLGADYPTVTWVAEIKLAMSFDTRLHAMAMAQRLQAYGTVGIEPRGD
jgi:hypothetical protein